MYSTILFTGGAGFVGSNLAIAFKKEYPESQIIALDNLKRRGSELNIPRLQEAGVKYIHGDIRNLEDLEFSYPIELLIECSAEPSVLAGYGESPTYLLNTNLAGTINCLELARKHKADFVFLSTSRVYPFKTIRQLDYTETISRFHLSDQQSVPGASSFGIAEDFPLASARSLYGTTKLASELILEEYISMYGIRGIINRCGVLTGPWQMGKVDQGVIVLWMARHMFSGKLTYNGYGGQGKQVRDILHILDLYELLKLQLQQINIHNGQIYNVGGGLDVSLSLQELTDYCQQLTGKKINIEPVVEERDADIPYYISDCRRIQSRTNWKPKYTTFQILEEIKNWIEQHERQLKSILS